MKKITLSIVPLLFAILTFAQNGNIVVFSEGGERFTLILNGVKHNATPQTNVKVENMAEAPYKAKIMFEDRTMETMSKTLYANSGMENTYNIKRKKKDNSLVIRMASQTPVSSTPVEKEVVVINNNNTNNDVTTTHTTTTTTTTINDNSGNTDGESISMNVNINGVGMNVDIKDNTNNSNVNVDVNESYTYTETTTTTTTGNVNQNTNPVSNARCDYPMDNSDFVDGKKSIESKTFADSKMTIAKQIVKANCPTAVQVRGFTKLFTFENDKLEFAKFAHQYCYDKGNYYKVNDAFEFESTIEELDVYIGK